MADLKCLCERSGIEFFLYRKKSDDDDEDDELFLWYGWPMKGIYALFPAETIVRDSHHRKSSTHRKQDLNLRKIWVQTLLSEVVQEWLIDLRSCWKVVAAVTGYVHGLSKF